MQVTGTKVCANTLIIYARTTYCFPSRTLISQLQDVINKLTSQHLKVQPMPDTTSNQEKSDGLDVPDSPQPLDQEDYPYVSHWCEEDWVQYTERQHDRGQVPPRLGFLTNEEGSPVPEPWIKTFMSATKQAWNELYRVRLDPKSWMKKTPKAAVTVDESPREEEGSEDEKEEKEDKKCICCL